MTGGRPGPSSAWPRHPADSTAPRPSPSAVSASAEPASRLWRPAGLPGLECLAADFRRQAFSRHFHEGYALGVITRGALGFRYRGEGVVAPVGSVNLVVPGEPHDGAPAAPDGWAYRMFYLEPALLRQAAEDLAQRPAGLPWFSSGVLNNAGLARQVAALHHDLAPAGPFSVSALEAETRLRALLVRWIARHADAPPTGRPPRPEPRAVRLGREILEDRFAEDLSLADLAQVAGLSPFHFARLFQSAFGLPPHAYLNQVRVRRAEALLATSMRLADVAAEVGFADQSHLTRQFKRLTGLTPARYRKILQEK